MHFAEYEVEAAKTAIYDKAYRAVYPALGLAGESGEVAEKVKKVLRDNNGVFDDDVITELGKEIGDVLWYLSALAHDLGLTLEGCAINNIEKLQSRQERGVLGGSGDNR